MMLPAAAARFWVRSLEGMCLLAVAIGVISSYVGLLISYHVSVASGPAIILTAGTIYIVSLVFGRRGIVTTRAKSNRHRIA
jgi:zinc/manganese transport system permease protein